MIYENVKKGIFISRPNRFIANVEIDGVTQVCHVKNTGRCKELLTEGAKVILQEWDKAERKTKFDLISVYKGDTLINMDSQAPNKVVKEWLESYFEGVTFIKSEAKYKNSRFDFYIEAGERKIFAEVKGVTLEEEGIAMFPDAPTERGVKHIKELIKSVKNGYEAYILFVIQMKGIYEFVPNDETHKAFGDALREAKENGVKIVAMDCGVTPDSISVRSSVKVNLE